jgi:hypothetical protein
VECDVDKGCDEQEIYLMSNKFDRQVPVDKTVKEVTTDYHVASVVLAGSCLNLTFSPQAKHDSVLEVG